MTIVEVFLFTNETVRIYSSSSERVVGNWEASLFGSYFRVDGDTLGIILLKRTFGIFWVIRGPVDEALSWMSSQL